MATEAAADAHAPSLGESALTTLHSPAAAEDAPTTAQASRPTEDEPPSSVASADDPWATGAATKRARTARRRVVARLPPTLKGVRSTDADAEDAWSGFEDFGSWPAQLPTPVARSAPPSPEPSQPEDPDGLEVISSAKHRVVPKSRLITSPEAIAQWEADKAAGTLPRRLQSWEDFGPPHDAARQAYEDAYALYRSQGRDHLKAHSLGPSRLHTKLIDQRSAWRGAHALGA